MNISNIAENADTMSTSSSSSSSSMQLSPLSNFSCSSLTPDLLIEPMKDHHLNMQSQLDNKLDSIYSLASILNSRNLQQNSQILLNLTESKEYCQNMRHTNFVSILTQIINDEWRELYDYLDNFKRLNNGHSFKFANVNMTSKNSSSLLMISSNTSMTSLNNTSSTSRSSCSSSSSSNFSIESDKIIEIVSMRLSARKQAKKALRNIISTISNNQNSNDNVTLRSGSKNDKLEMKIFDVATTITEYSESFLSFVLKNIKSNVEASNDNNSSYDDSFAIINDLNKLSELKESISDLLKRSFDEQQKKILVELGVLPSICELIEIFWNFLESYYYDDFNRKDLLNRITLESIIVLNNLTFLNRNLNLIICSRRFTLNALHKCLSNCYLNVNRIVIEQQQHQLSPYYSTPKTSVTSLSLNSNKTFEVELDLIKLIASLIKNLNTKEQMNNIKNSTTNVNNQQSSNSNILIDNQAKVSAHNFNEFNFTDLLTRCLLIYSSKTNRYKQRPAIYFFNLNQSTLKSILNSLLTLSLSSIDNKAKICNVIGSLAFLIDLISTSFDFTSKQDESIVELGICLLRSLSVFYSMHEQIRNELKANNFYQILLDVSLTSSNMNVVANACCILWSMTARSTKDNELLINLGAESRLKALTYSTHKLISMASMAALKNIYCETVSLIDEDLTSSSNGNLNNLNDNHSFQYPLHLSASMTSLSISSLNHQIKNKSFTNLNQIASKTENTEKSSPMHIQLPTPSIKSSSSFSSSHSNSNMSNSTPLLTSRNRKQTIENSNEFFQKLNSTAIIDDICFNEDDDCNQLLEDDDHLKLTNLKLKTAESASSIESYASNVSDFSTFSSSDTETSSSSSSSSTSSSSSSSESDTETQTETDSDDDDDASTSTTTSFEKPSKKRSIKSHKKRNYYSYYVTDYDLKPYQRSSRNHSKNSYYLKDHEPKDDSSYSLKSDAGSEYDNTSLTKKTTSFKADVNKTNNDTPLMGTKKSIIKKTNVITSSSNSNNTVVKQVKHVTFNEMKEILFEEDYPDYEVFESKEEEINEDNAKRSYNLPIKNLPAQVDETKEDILEKINENVEIIDVDLEETTKLSQQKINISSKKISSKMILSESSFKPKNKFQNSNASSKKSLENSKRPQSRSKSPQSDFRFIKSTSMIFNSTKTSTDCLSNMLPQPSNNHSQESKEDELNFKKSLLVNKNVNLPKKLSTSSTNLSRYVLDEKSGKIVRANSKLNLNVNSNNSNIESKTMNIPSKHSANTDSLISFNREKLMSKPSSLLQNTPVTSPVSSFPSTMFSSTISSKNKMNNLKSSNADAMLKKSESILSINKNFRALSATNNANHQASSLTNSATGTRSANLTSWSSIVTMNKTCQMRCDRILSSISSNSNTKPKLIGLVRPIIPAKPQTVTTTSSSTPTDHLMLKDNTKIKSSNINNNNNNMANNLKTFTKQVPVLETKIIKSSTRLQSSNLIKKNNFIIEDQLKKNSSLTSANTNSSINSRLFNSKKTSVQV